MARCLRRPRRACCLSSAELRASEDELGLSPSILPEIVDGGTLRIRDRIVLAVVADSILLAVFLTVASAWSGGSGQRTNSQRAKVWWAWTLPPRAHPGQSSGAGLHRGCPAGSCCAPWPLLVGWGDRQSIARWAGRLNRCTCARRNGGPPFVGRFVDLAFDRTVCARRTVGGAPRASAQHPRSAGPGAAAVSAGSLCLA